MLSPRWAKVRGDLRAHAGRTILAIVAMAVGLAGAGTVLDAWALVQVATRDGFQASDPAAATLRVDTITEGLLARVRSVPGVRDVESRRTVVIRADVEGTGFTAMLFVPESGSLPRIGRPLVAASDWPAPAGALLVERSSLDFSGASLGGQVTLTDVSGTPRAVRVSGFVRDVTLAPGWMEHLVYGFTSRETIRALGLADAPNEIRLVVDDRTLDQTGVRRIALAVRDTLRAAGRTVVEIDVPKPGEHVHAAQMDSLLYTQGAFGLIALLLSGFLVINLITAMLAGQVREIGILKTLGARSSQIATLYLTLALALGAVSALIAVPISAVLGRQYAALKAELLNFDLAGHALPSWVVMLQVVVGLLVPLLAAAIPVWRGCRLSVADALRDVGIVDTGAAPAFLHRVRGVHRPLLLALRNAFRRRQRLLLTLLALASAGAVFIGARNLRRAVRGSTDLVFAAMRYDLSVRLAAAGDPEALAAAVRAVSGVEDAESWSSTSATIDVGDDALSDGFTITAPPAATRLFAPAAITGRWVAEGGAREIVLGRTLYRTLGDLPVGSTLALRIAGRTEQWTVVGIVDAEPAPTAYTSREALTPLVGPLVRTVVVRAALRGEASQVELIQRVRRALDEAGHPVASTTRLAESRRVMEDHLLMVVDFLGAMAWLMLVVGALGLGSAMTIAVMERTREIGVLRALGARNGMILRMVLAESLTIGLMSWALALPLSVPMSLALGEAFGRIMVPVPARYLPDTAAMLGWLVLVIVVAVVASLWPARRAVDVPAARALSYE